MSNQLTRPFHRAAKRLTGQPLTLDDISSITVRWPLDSDTRALAVRQSDGQHWTVKDGIPGNRYTAEKDLTLSQALDYLERSEEQGRTCKVSYNHFSKIREMTGTAAEPAPQQLAIPFPQRTQKLSA